MPPLQTRQTPIELRAAIGSGRQKEATIATDAPTNVFDFGSGRVIQEVLLLARVEFQEPIVVLNDHDRSIPSTIGSAINVRKEPGKLIASLRFGRTAAADDAWSLVSEGHVRGVSIGYRILEATEILPGRSATVDGKTFAAGRQLLRVVSRWELKEISITPVPADTTAGIRSFSQPSSTRSVPNMFHNFPNMRSMSFLQVAQAILRGQGRYADADGDQFNACRMAFSAVDGVSELESLLVSWCLDGWRSAADSLAGLYRIESAGNYLRRELATIQTHPRPGRIPRGGTAPSASFGIGAEHYRLMKFGLSFVIDQQDFIDGRAIGVYEVGVQEMLRSCRNLVSDLLWAVVLSNPDMADGNPAFDASRGNLGNEAFGELGLAAAVTAIAGQTSTDAAGFPVHLGLRPNILVVSPSNAIPARKALHPLVVDGNEFSLRVESRLDDVGVLDPRDNETMLVGNKTNWLLGADAHQRCSLVLATLDGRVEPDIRVTELSQGQWGWAIDVSFSAAAAFADSKALYWSSGTV